MSDWFGMMGWVLAYMIGLGVFGVLVAWADEKFFGGHEKLLKGIGAVIGAALLLAFCSPSLPFRVQ